MQWPNGWRQVRRTVLANSTSLRSMLHGPTHWAGVGRVGVELAARTPGADRDVVLFFSLLHDAFRLSDGHDPEHGSRAADFAVWLHEGGVLPLTSQQLDTLCIACAEHSEGRISDDLTIGCCWDADRLNLWRVRPSIDQRSLSTAAARLPELFAWSAFVHGTPWSVSRSGWRRPIPPTAKGRASFRRLLAAMQLRGEETAAPELTDFLDLLALPGAEGIRAAAALVCWIPLPFIADLVTEAFARPISRGVAQLLLADAWFSMGSQRLFFNDTSLATLRDWFARADFAGGIACPTLGSLDMSALPEEFEVWRGGAGDPAEVMQGSSWSLDRAIASIFAIDDPRQRPPVLLRRRVRREEVAMYVNNTTQEVVILDCDQPCEVFTDPAQIRAWAGDQELTIVRLEVEALNEQERGRRAVAQAWGQAA